MEIRKYNLSVKRYPNHVKKTLAGISCKEIGEEWIIIVLCRRCENLSRFYKTAPVFSFDSAEKESVQAEILEWVEKISNEKFFSPTVRVQYMVAILSSNEYDSFLDADVEDEHLKIAGRAVMQAMMDALPELGL